MVVGRAACIVMIREFLFCEFLKLDNTKFGILPTRSSNPVEETDVKTDFIR